MKVRLFIECKLIGTISDRQDQGWVIYSWQAKLWSKGYFCLVHDTILSWHYLLSSWYHVTSIWAWPLGQNMKTRTRSLLFMRQLRRGNSDESSCHWKFVMLLWFTVTVLSRILPLWMRSQKSHLLAKRPTISCMKQTHSHLRDWWIPNTHSGILTLISYE